MRRATQQPSNPFQFVLIRVIRGQKNLQIFKFSNLQIMKSLLLAACLLTLGISAQASNVGKRYPSEKRIIVDRSTGRTLTVLTASAEFSEAKPYQTHTTWTADGSWIVFRSARGGNGTQLFVVNEITGDIVQLTDSATVNAGTVNLSRRDMKLFYLRGGNSRRAQGEAQSQTPRQVVELNIGLLLQHSAIDSLLPSHTYERVVATLPPDMNGSALALDADESKLYLGINLAPVAPRTPRQPAPAAAPATAPASDRTSIDSRNTDPTEAREAARIRFAEAGKGKSGIRAIDIKTGAITTVIDVDLRMGHLQANPWTAGEIIYCHETTGDAVQRIWAVNADGSNHRPIYAETPDEWITHETVATPDELMFLIMGHLPYLREKPTGIAVVNLRTKQMKIIGQVEEAMPNGTQGGFWHCNGSPDGRWAVGDTFLGSIYAIDRLTGQRHLLTTGHRMKPDHTHPIFSPDSKRVLIQSGLLSEGKRLCLITVNL
jgi:oligogalacturonide lyase